jgi:hypothetical protein
MLSWIFRHRARLAPIYGAVEAPPLAGNRFATPSALPVLARRGRKLRPGEWRGRGARLEIRPMARRVA